MVRATFAGFSTALSAIQANQKRLDIVGQNLANMNTVGYTRQQLETSSLNYTNPVSHYMNGSEVQVGFGTKMEKVSQIRDPYLDVQYRDQIVKSSYNDSLQTSLDSLSKFLDESNISGIRQAFDDIQSTLTNMQDPAKINNPIYETELQARMRTLTNLLNDAARQIEKAEAAEYQRLDGTGTTEQGAVQKVNDILKQIGNLNIQIKRNQIHGQPSLELMDQRNVLLDELASYVPIDVTYKNEKAGTDGEKEWPDDLYVDILYKNPDGTPQKLTVISGTDGGEGKNYGEIAVQTGSIDDPVSVSLKLREAQGNNVNVPDFKYNFKAGNDGTINAGKTFSSGSIQANLDMLGQTGSGKVGDEVRGYQYYMNQLDKLASTFANTINKCNNPDPNDSQHLLVNSTTDSTIDITAKNITINPKWVDGSVHVSTNPLPENQGGQGSTSDTVIAMLASMSKTYGNLDNNSFADYMNHVSTILAHDSATNQTILETNVTVLNGIQDAKDSMSAVSLDEEAANMMAFLSAYNAASRLMTTLDQALDTLINNTGVVGR